MSAWDICGCALFFGGLICAAVIDAKKWIIPNWTLLPIISAAGIFILTGFVGWLEALIGGVAFFLIFVVVILAGADALGGGDIKLIVCAALCVGYLFAAFGFALSVAVFALQCLIKGTKRAPFGPAVLVGFGGVMAVRIVLSFFG